MAKRRASKEKRKAPARSGRKRDGRDKNGGTNRATETHRSAARRARFLRIAELQATSASGKQIVRAVADEFGITERMAYLDLHEVYEAARPAREADHAARIEDGRDYWRTRREYLEACARELYDHAEFKGAAAYEGHANYAADRCSKIDGVYAPKKFEISGVVDVKVAVRQVGDAFADAPTDVLAALRLVQAHLAARGVGSSPRQLGAGSA